MRGKVGGGVDGCGAVGAADYADRRGLRAGKAQQVCADVGHENAQLGGCAQKQGLGVGDKGGKVCARAHAYEDKAGINAQLYAQVQVVQKAAVTGAELSPVDMAVGKELGVVHPRAGQVRQQHTEGDGQEQQRLELFHYSQVQQHAGNEYHHKVQRLACYLGKAGALQESLYCFHRLHSFYFLGSFK